jgi:hypothetical protein
MGRVIDDDGGLVEDRPFPPTSADASARKAPAGDGEPVEKLTNKAEAIRRALAKLGNKAKPAEIQGFIKTNFGIEMNTPLISVYKSKLVKKKGKPGHDLVQKLLSKRRQELTAIVLFPILDAGDIAVQSGRKMTQDEREGYLTAYRRHLDSLSIEELKEYANDPSVLDWSRRMGGVYTDDFSRNFVK